VHNTNIGNTAEDLKQRKEENNVISNSNV